MVSLYPIDFQTSSYDSTLFPVHWSRGCLALFLTSRRAPPRVFAAGVIVSATESQLFDTYDENLLLKSGTSCHHIIINICDNGLCCLGEECGMPCKSVTFYHRCIGCGGFLHVTCGIVDAYDCLTCHHCIQRLHSRVAKKSPSKPASLAATMAATASPTAQQCNVTPP